MSGLPNKTVGQRIASARHCAGIRSQSELGRRVSVKPTAVQNWEADSVIPRQSRLTALAAALNVSPAWLLFGIDEAIPAVIAKCPAGCGCRNHAAPACGLSAPQSDAITDAIARLRADAFDLLTQLCALDLKIAALTTQEKGASE